MAQQIWCYDCEWAPDLMAGRRLYHLSADVADEEVMRVMWEHAAGYDPERNPQPFLKTILCRLVSIAAVVRTVSPTSGVSLALWSVPALGEPLVGEPRVDPAGVPEADVLQAFLGHYERRSPVLVGYNSRSADLHILFQRAFVNGLQLPAFFREATAKPWNQEGVDLMDCLGGHGHGYSASLNEVANLCGIPGKLDTTGDDVARLYYGGKLRGVVEYNMFDALTTYLVWLRYEFFSGRFTPAQYAEEQTRLRDLVVREAQKPEGGYLNTYLEAWEALT